MGVPPWKAPNVPLFGHKGDGFFGDQKTGLNLLSPSWGAQSLPSILLPPDMVMGFVGTLGTLVIWRVRSCVNSWYIDLHAPQKNRIPPWHIQCMLMPHLTTKRDNFMILRSCQTSSFHLFMSKEPGYHTQVPRQHTQRRSTSFPPPSIHVSRCHRTRGHREIPELNTELYSELGKSESTRIFQNCPLYRSITGKHIPKAILKIWTIYIYI